MSAALRDPVRRILHPVSKGPQLVRTGETIAATAPVEAIDRADPHPLVLLFLIAGIAATGAITLVGSIAMWLLLHDTGVNWMFQDY
jgi:hypothetical protein